MLQGLPLVEDDALGPILLFAGLKVRRQHLHCLIPRQGDPTWPFLEQGLLQSIRGPMNFSVMAASKAEKAFAYRVVGVARYGRLLSVITDQNPAIPFADAANRRRFERSHGSPPKQH